MVKSFDSDYHLQKIYAEIKKLSKSELERKLLVLMVYIDNLNDKLDITLNMKEIQIAKKRVEEVI